MAVDAGSSVRLRRVLAVFIDAVVFFALWTVVGLIFRQGSLLITLGVFFVADLILTAVFGRSIGRWATGIRVAGANGGPPGPMPALIRTVLVFVSGWAGLLAYYRLGRISYGARLWWDAAAGTHLVRA